MFRVCYIFYEICNFKYTMTFVPLLIYFCKIPVTNWTRFDYDSTSLILNTAGEGKAWESLLCNPNRITLHRKESVACFRMQTGHDYLVKHLHRIGVLPSKCLLCNIQDMTALHLQTCPSLDDKNFSQPTLTGRSFRNDTGLLGTEWRNCRLRA